MDPTTYENPQNALLDFTKELDASCISIEATIGGGKFSKFVLLQDTLLSVFGVSLIERFSASSSK